MATQDMIRRLAALRESGADIIDVLWERARHAEAGAGYSYEYFERVPTPIESA